MLNGGGLSALAEQAAGLLRPVETVTPDGDPCCHWPAQEIAPDNVRRDLFHMFVHEEAQTWGFAAATVTQVGLERRIELLGPDSPGEYVYAFDRRLIDVRYMDDLTRDIVWWIRRMGAVRKGYRYG